MKHRYVRRALMVAATGVVLLGAAASCGGDSHHGMDGMNHSASPATSGTAGHDNADVMFAQMMIPHHQQAVAMAELAPDRAASTGITTLAAQIKNAQGPEIDTMTGWLTSWGEPTASSMRMGDGMMSDADMARLKAASGTNFDVMFAQMMIGHHQGAITMAQDEVKNGTNADARKLAQQIITTQSAEIKTLRRYAGT